MLSALAEEGEIAVLLIEQNIGVATTIAENVAIMVNGRIHRVMSSRALADDRELQQRLLGVGRHEDEAEAEPDAARREATEERVSEVFQVVRGGNGADLQPPPSEAANIRTATSLPNRWSLTEADLARGVRSSPAARQKQEAAAPPADIFEIPLAERHGRTALVVGTFDTKGRELKFIRDRLRDLGIRTRTVDLSTSGKPSSTDVTPQEVAGAHPRGASAVFTGDRGQAVKEMALAFERWIVRQRDVGGIISAGGSGGTSLATAGMRRLPLGVPKIMISTVASGDVGRYVGPATS